MKEFNLPSWIDQWLGMDSIVTDFKTDDLRVSCQRNRDRALVVAEIRGAGELPDSSFSHAARRAYEAIANQVRQLALSYPIRIWNSIPAIHQPSIDGDRYMSFNFGRYQAMRQWFEGDFVHHVPAATGVGSDDDTLRVAVLLSPEPGTPIENPRQVPAYQYSPRYGRLPPCFARATRLRDLLFVAGTAAVVGEESQHPRDFNRQLEITCEHLRLMLERGFEHEPSRRFVNFRVYLPEQPERNVRTELVRSALARLAETGIEFVKADLCRRDLLVEIEALGTTGQTILG